MYSSLMRIDVILMFRCWIPFHSFSDVFICQSIFNHFSMCIFNSVTLLYMVNLILIYSMRTYIFKNNLIKFQTIFIIFIILNKCCLMSKKNRSTLVSSNISLIRCLRKQTKSKSKVH